MNYKQCDEKKKVQIDTLLANGYSMRKAAKALNISHSTISRYKNKVYKKREVNLNEKYKDFLNYLYKNYCWRSRSIEVCVHQFKKYYPHKPSVTMQQVYKWIHEGKIEIKEKDTCYKRRKRKKSNGMMKHTLWNIENKTVLPISLRPKSIEKRDEIGHLEIDSIIGKRNEQGSILSIVDRCTRMVWLIKAEYKHEYYINNLIRKYITENEIEVKSITVDNGVEFKALGIAAKTLGVKLYKCDPYCSFQRGSNERMNGIVRRYIPKGNSMWKIEQQYLDDIAFKINSMPRKLFDFSTAFEVEFKQLHSGAVEI